MSRGSQPGTSRPPSPRAEPPGSRLTPRAGGPPRLPAPGDAAAPPLRPPRLGSPRAAEISSSMNNEWKMQPEPRAAAGRWAQRRGQGGSWERGTRGTRKAHPSPPSLPLEPGPLDQAGLVHPTSSRVVSMWMWGCTVSPRGEQVARTISQNHRAGLNARGLHMPGAAGVRFYTVL